jgi:transcriptional/translational regulatory protein YebC/TACO1
MTNRQITTKAAKRIRLIFTIIILYFKLKNKFEIISSGFERIPTITKELNEEQQADVDKLLEKIEEDDDVQNVFHTMA